MKNITSLIAATVATVALFTTSGFAASADQAAASKTTKPAPIEIVHPSGLARELENATVNLVLTIDERGVPHNVRPAQYMDSRMAAPLIRAVSQWRFTPKYVDGRAVPARVMLPLQLVAGA